MNVLSIRGLALKSLVLLGVTSLLLTGRTSAAGSVPSRLLRSFAFPVTFANGLTADLVMPAGSTTTLRFDVAKVAIGELPVPLPQRARGRGRGGREFVRPADVGTHARLLLSGVVDGDGHLVNSAGHQVVIDAVVSPSSAASSAPPFVIPFDITNGMAFVDALLPIQAASDGSVRVQILGVTLIDAEGLPFGILGFQLSPVRSTPAPRPTPNPGGTPPPADCADRAECAGPCSVQCSDGHLTSGVCAGDGSCQCSANCEPGPTPTPGACSAANCSGDCTVTCADGTTVSGECAHSSNNRCECSANCGKPCGAGQCFDTIAFRCTGQPCGPDLHCPLANQFCDVSGQRCPCAPPPPPHGRVCCQCQDASHACFDFSFVEVQPICPQGCQTFLGRECDPSSDSCVPLIPCASDTDCDDGNGCTIDRCTADGCTHDCVCVGPMACGPGPGRGSHH